MLLRLWEWLQKLPDPQTHEQHIQWLMRGLCDPDRETRAIAQHSFANLCVNRHTDYTPDEVIATFRALQEQEDILDYSWVLRHVEFVSEPSPVMKIPREVREAAKQCLHRMRERTEPDYLPKTLLHPTSAPLADPGVLLRPAQGSASSPTLSHQLVRPAEGSVTGNEADAGNV